MTKRRTGLAVPASQTSAPLNTIPHPTCQHRRLAQCRTQSHKRPAQAGPWSCRRQTIVQNLFYAM
jgi:hypothetical protein